MEKWRHHEKSDASPATAGIITVTKNLEFSQESKVLPEGFPREPAGINSVTKKKTQYIDFIWKSYRFYKYLLISSI